MHRSVRGRLEYLLANRGNACGHRQVSAHLASCAKCSSEISLMQEQAALLKSLRAPAELDPSPGFYARVVQLIEDQKATMWGAFICSPFAKRLLYASLSVAVMLGTYVVTQEARDGHLLGVQTVIAQNGHYDAPVTGDQSEQRDAVLENFVIHEGLVR